MEDVIIFSGQRFQLIKDLLFRYRSQEAVAANAAAEGTDLPSQVIEVDDFSQLPIGKGFPDEMAEFYFLPFEELDISAQQDTFFPGCYLGQIRIVPLGIMEGVKTGHPQFPGKFSYVGIHQEADGR